MNESAGVDFARHHRRLYAPVAIGHSARVTPLGLNGPAVKQGLSRHSSWRPPTSDTA